MELKRRPDVERFLKSPDANIRAALIYGRDLGVVRDRGHALAAKLEGLTIRKIIVVKDRIVNIVAS